MQKVFWALWDKEVSSYSPNSFLSAVWKLVPRFRYVEGGFQSAYRKHLGHIWNSYFCPLSLLPPSFPSSSSLLLPSLPPFHPPFLLPFPSLPPSLPPSEAITSKMLMSFFVTSWTNCTLSCREGPTQMEAVAISGMTQLCQNCLEAGFRVM